MRKVRPSEILLTGLVFVLGLLFIGTAWHGYGESRGYKEFSVIVPGNVSEKRIEQPEGGAAQYCLDFRFKADGREISSSRCVDRQLWNAVKPDDNIDVRFVPSDPDRNMLAAESKAPAVFFFFVALMGGVFLLFSLMRVIYLFKS